MSSSFNFDGLSSGLNTTEIISQLMQIEARPQTLLKNRMQQFQDADTSFGTLRSQLTSLKTAASALGNILGWEAITATSTDPDAVSLTASGAASTGSIAIRVMSLASKAVQASTGTVADRSTTPVVAGGASITLGTSAGSTSVTVGGTGTLDDVVAAINSQTEVGLTAAAIQVSPGAYRLQLSAKENGETIAFDASQIAMGGGWIDVSTASNAVVRVGPDGSSYDITSTTNTIQDVLLGTSITLKKADPATTITLSSEPDKNGIADKVQKIVEAYNTAVGEIAKQTKYDAGTKKRSALTGESSVRQLQSVLADAVIGTAETSASTLGITLARDGTLAFDRGKFLTAYEADPTKVRELFTAGAGGDGLGRRITAAIDSAVNATDGFLTTAQKAKQATVTDLQEQIDKYQRRLDARQVALRKQFTALESALGSLKSQSNWLAGQLGAPS